MEEYPFLYAGLLYGGVFRYRIIFGIEDGIEENDTTDGHIGDNPEESNPER